MSPPNQKKAQKLLSATYTVWIEALTAVYAGSPFMQIRAMPQMPACFYTAQANVLKFNFNAPVFFLFNFYDRRIESTNLRCKQNFGINIFDYEGHNPLRTQYILCSKNR